MPHDCEVRVVFQEGQYVLQLHHPKSNKCEVRVVVRNGRYILQLDPKTRPSVASLEALMARDLSAWHPLRVQKIGADAWHALGGVERAAAVPVVLSAAQVAAKRAALLVVAHRRVLICQTELLVLLARVPTDTSLHDAAPAKLHKDDEGENHEGENHEGEIDGEDEGYEDEDEDEDYIDGEDDDDESDDEADATDEEDEEGADDGEFDAWWWAGYAYAERCANKFARRYTRPHPWYDVLERLVLWSPARPLPEAFMQRVMPKTPEAGRPSLADFLRPLRNAGLVRADAADPGRLYMPPWVRYYYQRELRDAGRLRSVFASMLRILVSLGLPPLAGPAEETWDGFPMLPARLAPLGYLELLVPYGSEEDGSAQWERVARRYRERRSKARRLGRGW